MTAGGPAPTNVHRGESRPVDRRFDRGSWIALGYALSIILYNLAMTVVLLSIPGDGWIYDGDLSRSAPRIVFTQQLIGTSSPIQPGDELVAIEGRSVADLADQAHAFYRQPRPAWPDGTVLQYRLARISGGSSCRLAKWSGTPASSVVVVGSTNCTTEGGSYAPDSGVDL